METPAGSTPSPSSTGFAGLLASLTSTAGSADREPAWSDGDLGEDVVTLSHERALRNHGGYTPGEGFDGRDPPADDGDKAPPAAQMEDNAVPRVSAAPDSPVSPELRTASVTIRLSNSESAQLRQRAAEAGMTVSAYLRSCVLEADALRALVKEALAELKTAAGPEGATPPVRRRWRWWFGRREKRREAVQTPAGIGPS
jgi:hypothetical protein